MTTITGAATVLALAGAALGLSALPSFASATSLASETPCVPGSQVNPMMAATPIGSADGFTVRSLEGMTLGNSEAEGSIAVGGVLTTAGQNDYPLRHKLAGYGNYSLPTIDGDPTRLLVQQWSGTGRIVQIMNTSPSGTVRGYLKLSTWSVPSDDVFGQLKRDGAGGTGFARAGASNQEAALQSWSQLWDGTGASAKAAQAANAYFPDDLGAELLAGVYADGRHVQALSTSGERTLVLDASTTNWIAMGELGRTGKIRLDDGLNAGVDEEEGGRPFAKTALYVKVSDADIDGGVLSVPSLVARQQAQYLLFDLSGVTVRGPISIVADNGGKLGGAIYAPEQAVLMERGTFEGQVIARSYKNTAAGDEIHTLLFQATVPCTASTASATATATATPTARRPRRPHGDGVPDGACGVCHGDGVPDGVSRRSLRRLPRRRRPRRRLPRSLRRPPPRRHRRRRPRRRLPDGACGVRHGDGVPDGEPAPSATATASPTDPAASPADPVASPSASATGPAPSASASASASTSATTPAEPGTGGGAAPSATSDTDPAAGAAAPRGPGNDPEHPTTVNLTKIEPMQRMTGLPTSLQAAFITLLNFSRPANN